MEFTSACYASRKCVYGLNAGWYVDCLFIKKDETVRCVSRIGSRLDFLKRGVGICFFFYSDTVEARNWFEGKGKARSLSDNEELRYDSNSF